MSRDFMLFHVKITKFEIMTDIRFKLDPDTKLIKIAKRGDSCTKSDVMSSDSPRHRIYWEERKKPYVPQAESVSYKVADEDMTKMNFELTEKYFTNSHDSIEMEKLVVEFPRPLGMRLV